MPETTLTDLETGTYVYAVVPALEAAAPSKMRGIDDATVEFVVHGSLAAAVGQITLDRPPGRRRELVAHSDVVNALAGRGPVIPVRFGSIMHDESEVVADVLAAHHDHMVDTLERLRGTTQLNLRATYVEDQLLAEVVRDRPDIAELRRRTKSLPPGTPHPDLVRLGELVAGEVDDRREGDAQDLVDAVESRVIALSVRPGTGIERVVDLSMLVELEAVSSLEEHLEAIAEAVHERVHLELTGPMAPYDFVADVPWV